MRKYPFRKISQVGQGGLVEVIRDGAAERFILPDAILGTAGTVLTDDQIDSGIPYGLPFSEFMKPKEFSGALETALHNSGVWTLQDLKAKMQSVVDALQATYRLEAVKIIQAAEVYLTNEQNKSKQVTEEPATPTVRKTKKEKNG